MFEKECGFVMQMSKHAFIARLYYNIGRSQLNASNCMVCASVWEDNPRALASGLSLLHMHKPCSTNKYFLIALVCICNLCIARYLI